MYSWRKVGSSPLVINKWQSPFGILFPLTILQVFVSASKNLQLPQLTPDKKKWNGRYAVGTLVNF